MVLLYFLYFCDENNEKNMYEANKTKTKENAAEIV